MILVDAQHISETTILGTAEHEFVINNAILMQIFVKPATGTTTYDFSLKDVYDNVVYEETNCDGEYNQLVSVPTYGNIVFTIDNSFVDELYKIVLTFRRS